ncbi:MAG: glycosyltransferase [Desulfobacterales bacterium]|nr:glycosyltransferase [Desulfobacterales bacterium]
MIRLTDKAGQVVVMNAAAGQERIQATDKVRKRDPHGRRHGEHRHPLDEQGVDQPLKEEAMHPSVSIVIRGYNRDGYIGRAIESVLAQTYEDFDLLVWDDGSTDRTAKVAIEYAKKDRRVRIAAYDHSGADSSRSKSALADTFGPYLCWVDSDDMLAPDGFGGDGRGAWKAIRPSEWFIRTTRSSMRPTESRVTASAVGFPIQRTGCSSTS